MGAVLLSIVGKVLTAFRVEPKISIVVGAIVDRWLGRRKYWYVSAWCVIPPATNISSVSRAFAPQESNSIESKNTFGNIEFLRIWEDFSNSNEFKFRLSCKSNEYY